MIIKEIRVRLKNYYSDQTFELREVNSSLNLIVIYDHTEGTYSTKSLDKVIEVELVEVNWRMIVISSNVWSL